MLEGVAFNDPEPRLPAFELGETVDELVSSGVINSECERIFRIKDTPEE